MQAALADLAKQDPPNYMATSKKTGILRKMLSDRFTELHGSQQAANSKSRQCLNDAQEEALIQLINRLTNRDLPPTNSIVRNLAEEIIGRRVGKNWSGHFVRRQRDRLISRYLNNIDQKCQNAEYAPVFQRFFQLVLLFVACNMGFLSSNRLT